MIDTYLATAYVFYFCFCEAMYAPAHPLFLAIMAMFVVVFTDWRAVRKRLGISIFPAAVQVDIQQ